MDNPSRIGLVKSRILRTYKRILIGIPWTPLAYPLHRCFFNTSQEGTLEAGWRASWKMVSEKILRISRDPSNCWWLRNLARKPTWDVSKTPVFSCGNFSTRSTAGLKSHHQKGRFELVFRSSVVFRSHFGGVRILREGDGCFGYPPQWETFPARNPAPWGRKRKVVVSQNAKLWGLSWWGGWHAT